MTPIHTEPITVIINTNTSSSNMGYYDTQGRYTELENLADSINQNAVTTGIVSINNAIAVFFDDITGSTDSEILSAYKLYRRDNIVVVSTGIRGDSLYLLSIVKHCINTWYGKFADTVSAAYLARVIADYMHEYTLRKNMRPLGTILLIADTENGAVYKINVDSAYEKGTQYIVGRYAIKIETSLKEAKITSIEELEATLTKLKKQYSMPNLRTFIF